MLSAKFLLVVIVTTLWLSVCDFHFEAYGDACVNSPCQQASPPPVSGYPPPPSPPTGYSVYGPPPPPPEAGQSKCPPTAAGVQNPPAPPYNTYGYGPPNPYTYVPHGGSQASASMLLPILVPLMMLSSCFIFLY